MRCNYQCTLARVAFLECLMLTNSVIFPMISNLRRVGTDNEDRAALWAPAGTPNGTRQTAHPTDPEKRESRLGAIYRNDRQLQLVLLATMLLVYGALLEMSRKLSPNLPLDLTFNSMLQHLMHGQFDVDPNIVGIEGFARGGRVYAYWGIWCALLRLPLWIVHRLDIDVTVWSCLAAVCIAGMAKVRTVLFLRRNSIRSPAADWAVGLMLGYILFGGSQIGYLRISIYQEAIFWAYAFATAFVYFSVKGLVNGWFSLGTLSCMAVCAGLAILTRVSTGIGLLLAMALLLLVLVVQSGMAGEGELTAAIRRTGSALAQSRVLIPLGILAALIIATGIVNYFRFGNPATFANYDLYLNNQIFPDKLARATFNLARVPFALLYYFLPVWVLFGRHGGLLLTQTLQGLFARVEMPSSFLLTDLLPFCFIASLGISLWRRRPRFSLRYQWAAALAIGYLAPCLLMLTYNSLTYRYRMEFYPEIDFLAFLGLYALLTEFKMASISTRYRKRMTTALVLSIAVSFVALSLYNLALAPPGKPLAYYHQAVQRFYR